MIFLSDFLAGGGGETVSARSADSPGAGADLITFSEALLGPDCVTSLLLRLGGATGAGAAASDAGAFDPAEAAEI